MTNSKTEKMNLCTCSPHHTKKEKDKNWCGVCELPITKTEKATPIKLSFDGHGFNDASNEYRERIATLSEYGKGLPKEALKRIETAVNSHDELIFYAEDILEQLKQFSDVNNAINSSYLLNALKKARGE